MVRKSQAEYVSGLLVPFSDWGICLTIVQEIGREGSSLTVPASQRKALVSRYNDPNHPANNGNIVSLVTGGKLGSAPQPSLLERMSTLQQGVALKSV